MAGTRDWSGGRGEQLTNGYKKGRSRWEEGIAQKRCFSEYRIWVTSRSQLKRALRDRHTTYKGCWGNTQQLGTALSPPVDVCCLCGALFPLIRSHTFSKEGAGLASLQKNEEIEIHNGDLGAWEM